MWYLNHVLLVNFNTHSFLPRINKGIIIIIIIIIIITIIIIIAITILIIVIVNINLQKDFLHPQLIWV